MLALLTANYRKSSNSFVRMLTKSDFIGKNRSEMTFNLIRAFLKDFSIRDLDVKTYLAPAAMSES